jgi:hypothetical protein
MRDNNMGSPDDEVGRPTSIFVGIVTLVFGIALVWLDYWWISGIAANVISGIQYSLHSWIFISIAAFIFGAIGAFLLSVTHRLFGFSNRPNVLPRFMTSSRTLYGMVSVVIAADLYFVADFFWGSHDLIQLIHVTRTLPALPIWLLYARIQENKEHGDPQARNRSQD